MFFQGSSKSSLPGYLRPTESSALKSSTPQNYVNSRVERKVPARESYRQRPPSPSPKNVQSSNWNTRNYDPQNYQKPSTTPNSQYVQLKFSNIDNKENQPPSREKNISPPSSRYFQNQHSNYPYDKPPKPSLPPSFVKENIPSYPTNSSQSKKSLETESTQNSSLHLPPLSQNTKQQYQDDKDKKPVYSPRKSNIASQQDSTLKEIVSNVHQQPGSRGRGIIRNQAVGELMKDPPLQNHNVGFSNNYQIPGRGISSDNRSSWHFNNLARKEKIVGIRNFYNTCFAGSLLQCLYHLQTFKECLYKCVKDHPSELIRLFEDLFRSMDRVNCDDVNNFAYNLIKRIFQIRSHEFKLGVQGSSEILFRAITEEFGDSSPLVQLFWKGRYSKIADCTKCPNKLKRTEDIFILHAKDIDYKPERADDGSLFQPRNELRKCRECRTQTPHSTNYIFESLPSVLVIAISDTIESKSSNKLISNISVQTKDGQTVKYEYFAGIANMGKGSIGVHSIAIVKSNENEGGGYFELNDSIARSLSSLDSVSLYPKLIFYQRANFLSPRKPETPPPPSNHVHSRQKIQPVKAFHLQDEKKEQEIVKETPKETLELVGRGRKKESGREFEENSQRLRNCVSVDAGAILALNPIRKDFGRRMPLENKDGTSFAGALLQCLYHLPKFKSYLYQYKNDHKDKIHPIAILLANFFDLMDTTDAKPVNEAACKFVEFMVQNYRFTKWVHGNSVRLWKTIYDELSSSHSAAVVPFLSLFSGTVEATTICEICREHMKAPQNFSTLELNERNYTETIASENLSFSLPPQNFKCFCRGNYRKTFIQFATFPEILVISIIPSVDTDRPGSKLLSRIELKGSDRALQSYEYQAGILTIVRADDGHHSIAVIQCGGNKGMYTFTDNAVTQADFSKIKYHPRLLFYRKLNELSTS